MVLTLHSGFLPVTLGVFKTMSTLVASTWPWPKLPQSTIHHPTRDCPDIVPHVSSSATHQQLPLVLTPSTCSPGLSKIKASCLSLGDQRIQTCLLCS